ncbi:MAG: sdrD 1, partial [Gemmataceae bacterium]|nr:sdrD 1 [Gemmataceae bacterium]
TATTDAAGHYLFTEAPGTYTVTVDTSTLPAGYTPTATGQGTTATDSNPNPSGTSPAALAPGGSDLTVDFGFYKLDLSITKTDGTLTFTPGTSTTYTIVVSNSGPSTAVNAPVSDILPASITGATWTAVASGTGASVAQASGTGNINTTVTLPAGTSVTFTLVAQISASAGGVDTLSDFSTLAPNNTALAQNVTVNGVRADAFYLSGGSYLTTNTTLFERNGGTDRGLGVVSNGENAALGGDVNEISNQLNLDVVRLRKTAGDRWSSVWVSSLDSGGSGGAETGTLYWSNSPTPDLGTLSASSFTFKFGDFGGAVEGNVLALNPPNFDPTAGYLFFRAGPNAAGTNNDYLLWKATTTTPKTLTNTATVAPPAGVTDSNPDNNTATDTDTPATQVDLAVTKTDGTPYYTPGTSTTYTIVVTNNGPAAVTNATVTDRFPSGITSATWTAVASAGASVAAASGTGNVNTAVSLVPGATVTFTVVAQISAAATGTLVNTVTVTPPAGVTDTNPKNNAATDTDTPLGIVGGHKYLDVSGNGLNLTAGPNSPADTPMAGVTVYLDLNNNGVRDTGEPATVTDKTGAYSFAGVALGTYYVREVVPAGFVRTWPTLTDANVATVAAAAPVSAANDFANAEVCDKSIVTCVSYSIDDCTTVSDLRGNTRPGDKVAVTFTVKLPAGVTSHAFTLVSYVAPGASFDAATASRQTIYDSATVVVTVNGTYTLTVLNPCSYYQVDFVCGGAIDKFGPAGSNIFYSAQNRLFSADNSGTNAYSTAAGINKGDFGAPSFWVGAVGQKLIKTFNGSATSTQLGAWLATTFPNLFGPGAGARSVVNANGTYFTTTQVAGVVKALTGADQQALATALSLYATSSYLEGSAAAALARYDGLHVTPAGSAGDNYTVGTGYGAAFGVADGTRLAVIQLLEAVDARTAPGAAMSPGAGTVLGAINAAGAVAIAASGTDAGTADDPMVLLSGRGDLRTGTITVAVDGLGGDAAAAEQTRIDDAVASLNGTLGQFGLILVEVSGDAAIDADIHLHLASTSIIGGAAQGVLGVTEVGGQITIVTGWDYYLGSDPAAVGAGQYDFETVVAHELGHAVGLGHSQDIHSVMFPYLSTAEERRQLTDSDLQAVRVVEDGSPEPLMATPFAAKPIPGCNCPACLAAAGLITGASKGSGASVPQCGPAATAAATGTGGSRTIPGGVPTGGSAGSAPLLFAAPNLGSPPSAPPARVEAAAAPKVSGPSYATVVTAPVAVAGPLTASGRGQPQSDTTVDSDPADALLAGIWVGM